MARVYNPRLGIKYIEQLISAVIIDDEEGARNALVSLVKRTTDDISILGTANSVATGIKLIEDTSPDLVLCDIQLLDGSGFDIVNLIDPSFKFQLIFITAHNEYAIDAFRVSALDYLLKPIRIKELKAALEKAIKIVNLTKENANSLNKEKATTDENSSENLPLKITHRKKFILPDVHGFKVYKLEDILYVEGLGNYCKIVFTSGKTVTVTKKLKEYEATLPDGDFYRIHRSHIINLNHVKGYQKGKTGVVTMADGQELKISREKKDEFLLLFKID